MIARKAIQLFRAGCLLLVCSSFAFSQTTGRIAGTVKDQNGAVIAEAEVTVVVRIAWLSRSSALVAVDNATASQASHVRIPL